MPLSKDTNRRAPSPFFIVMNAGSGDKDADQREDAIRSVLAAGKRPYRLWRVSDIRRLPEAAREAVQLARQQQGTVVAAGGDGTINAVVQEVLPSGRPFGVLPQGTFNYFSRAHGIPVDTEEACSLLLQGVLRPVQVGLVNQRPFLVNASVGLYPKLLEKREVHKQRFGRSRLVAALSGLATLLAPPPRLVLALDDGAGSDAMHICTLVVDNNPLQLRQVGLPEARAVQQGELAAIVVKAQGVGQLISALALAVLGKLGEADAVDSFSFKRLTAKPLHGGRRIKVATDGEVAWMIPPLVFQAAPDSLLLVVPRSKTVGGEGE